MITERAIVAEIKIVPYIAKRKNTRDVREHVDRLKALSLHSVCAVKQLKRLEEKSCSVSSAGQKRQKLHHLPLIPQYCRTDTTIGHELHATANNIKMVLLCHTTQGRTHEIRAKTIYTAILIQAFTAFLCKTLPYDIRVLYAKITHI